MAKTQTKTETTMKITTVENITIPTVKMAMKTDLNQDLNQKVKETQKVKLFTWMRTTWLITMLSA
jgi:predicted DNA binding CopG/RHH family protein